MTPVQRLADFVRQRYETNEQFENLVSNLKDQERINIETAIMHALDEDGHTGGWKIKFANDYYEKIKNK